MGVRSAGALVLATATAATACGGGASSATSARLRGTVVRGPTSPVCRTGQSCSKPAAKALLLFSRSGRAAVRVRTDAHGRYDASLDPGSYLVTIPRREGMSIAPRTARVTAGTTRRIDFRIDTGIR